MNTTISISLITKKDLITLGIKNESYNTIIKRLIKKCSKEQQAKDNLSKIALKLPTEKE